MASLLIHPSGQYYRCNQRESPQHATHMHTPLPSLGTIGGVPLQRHPGTARIGVPALRSDPSNAPACASTTLPAARHGAGAGRAAPQVAMSLLSSLTTHGIDAEAERLKGAFVCIIADAGTASMVPWTRPRSSTGLAEADFCVRARAGSCYVNLQAQPATSVFMSVPYAPCMPQAAWLSTQWTSTAYQGNVDVKA